MNKITAEKLISLGFELQEYPDGRFFVMFAHAGEPRFYAVTRALGCADYEAEYQGDKVILQCREDLSDWQYTFGALAGSLKDDECIRILDSLDGSSADWLDIVINKSAMPVVGEELVLAAGDCLKDQEIK